MCVGAVFVFVSVLEERQMIQIRALEEKNCTTSHGAVQHTTTTSIATQQQSFSSLLGRSFQEARNIVSGPFDEAMAVATSMTLASHQVCCHCLCVCVCLCVLLTALSLLYVCMYLLKVSNLKELRKDARREIGGKTTTLRNGTNIEQHRSNKALMIVVIATG